MENSTTLWPPFPTAHRKPTVPPLLLICPFVTVFHHWQGPERLKWKNSANCAQLALEHCYRCLEFPILHSPLHFHSLSLFSSISSAVWTSKATTTEQPKEVALKWLLVAIPSRDLQMRAVSLTSVLVFFFPNRCCNKFLTVHTRKKINVFSFTVCYNLNRGFYQKKSENKNTGIGKDLFDPYLVIGNFVHCRWSK